MSLFPFTKQPLNFDEQIGLLQSRGLLVENIAKATTYLKNISYYRLSAYFKPFESDPIQHLFQTGTTFQDIINLYQFDRRLRLSILDAIEKIEIALRAGMAQDLTIRHGAWWYLEPTLFKTEWTQPLPNGKPSPKITLENELQQLAKQQKEAFIKHFYQNYQGPAYPPSWMILECLSFGQCSNLFRYLRQTTDRLIVSQRFNLDPIILDSALECIRVMRNTCAHHARVWDRRHTYIPRKLNELQQAGCKRGTTKEQLMLLQLLVRPVAQDDSWRSGLNQLFKSFESVPFTAMGFEQDWQADRFWTT